MAFAVVGHGQCWAALDFGLNNKTQNYFWATFIDIWLFFSGHTAHDSKVKNLAKVFSTEWGRGRMILLLRKE